MNLTQQYFAKLESRKSYIEATERTILQLQKTKEVFNSQTDKSIEVIKGEADRQLQWLEEDLNALLATIGHVPPAPTAELKVA